jgi:Iron/manganese superoxide dismutases, alpha-hairpin domain
LFKTGLVSIRRRSKRPIPLPGDEYFLLLETTLRSPTVSKYNDAVKGTDLDSKSLDEVIKAIAGDDSQAGLFNDAAQAGNHTFS